ncbi:MAG: hypothetical protein GC131_05005 [Alphaproteobacteria bacterium]|nr:hypothetical protein [Alphaproteobacteria bacterium]
MGASEVAVITEESEETVSERARKRGSSDGCPAKMTVNRITNVVEVAKDFFKNTVRSVVVSVRYGADKGFTVIHQAMQYAKTGTVGVTANLARTAASNLMNLKPR